MSVTLRGGDRQGPARNSALAEAIRHVESALEPPHPGAESEWILRASRKIRDGARALATHRAVVDAPDGLYAQVEGVTPPAGPHLRGLRRQSGATLEDASHLERAAGAAAGDPENVDAVLARARELVGALWRLQQREVELLVQAYEQDIGAGD
ncbi:MAG: hypothetical protein ACK47B_01995 [Armatimonadota bacterium]